MIDNLTEAISHAKEVASKVRKNGNYLYFRGNSRMANECEECAKEHEQLAEWLTELQERRKADRWIPVSERLPDTDGRYLVLLEKDYAEDYSLPREQIENFEVEEGSFGVWYENYNMRTLGYLDSEWSAIPVIAWRPLPKPYESEDK